VPRVRYKCINSNSRCTLPAPLRASTPQPTRAKHPRWRKSLSIVPKLRAGTACQANLCCIYVERGQRQVSCRPLAGERQPALRPQRPGPLAEIPASAAAAAAPRRQDRPVRQLGLESLARSLQVSVELGSWMGARYRPVAVRELDADL
jgi:hypothetical protein